MRIVCQSPGVIWLMTASSASTRLLKLNLISPRIKMPKTVVVEGTRANLSITGLVCRQQKVGAVVETTRPIHSRLSLREIVLLQAWRGKFILSTAS